MRVSALEVGEIARVGGIVRTFARHRGVLRPGEVLEAAGDHVLGLKPQNGTPGGVHGTDDPIPADDGNKVA